MSAPSEGDETSGDDARKSYRTILEQEIHEGLVEIDRPASGLFLSGLSAGLDIGFGPLLMAVLLSSAGETTPALLRELFVASAYALGFVFVILGQSDLFTEQTVLATLPVLAREASPVELARLWGIIYAANLAGCVIFAGLAIVVGPAVNVVDPAVFEEIGVVLADYSWWGTLLGAVFAGWLMGLLSWLVVAARDTIGTIAVVWMVAGAIGIAHLPHSIAGTVEVLFGVLSGSEVTVLDYAGFLFWSTVGNVVGGVVFVALLKYSHVVRGGEEPGGITLSEKSVRERRVDDPDRHVDDRERRADDRR